MLQISKSASPRIKLRKWPKFTKWTKNNIHFFIASYRSNVKISKFKDYLFFRSFADKLKNMSQNHQSQTSESQNPKTVNNDDTVKVEIFDDDDQPVISNFGSLNQLQVSKTFLNL